MRKSWECFDDLMSNGYQINLDLNTPEGEKLIRSSQGLTIEEIRDAIRLSAVADEGITDNCYQRVSQLKTNKLRKLQVEFSELPDVAVGGLDNLKQWINQRSKL